MCYYLVIIASFCLHSSRLINTMCWLIKRDKLKTNFYCNEREYLALSSSGWPRRVQTISGGGCPDTTHSNVAVRPGSKHWFVNWVSKTGARCGPLVSDSPTQQSTCFAWLHNTRWFIINGPPSFQRNNLVNIVSVHKNFLVIAGDNVVCICVSVCLISWVTMRVI